MTRTVSTRLYVDGIIEIMLSFEDKRSMSSYVMSDIEAEKLANLILKSVNEAKKEKRNLESEGLL